MATLSVQAQATALDEDNHAKCRTLAQVLDRIGDKWTIMAVGALSDGPMRFNAIMRKIGGVSHRMLTLTLRGLERDGLVRRKAFPTIPPKVEYELTSLGHSLKEPLAVLLHWGENHSIDIQNARGIYDQSQKDPA